MKRRWRNHTAAYDWYAAQNPAAADAFINELDQASEQIGRNPNLAGLHVSGTRRYVMRRFPFTVIYREQATVIEVVAIAHGRRKPGGKKDLDHLVYEGHLIASSRVAQELTRLTGIEAVPVRSPRRPPDIRFKWLRITGSFPRMHASTTGVATENVCSTCGRAGHYADAMHPETPVYETVPKLASDFNLTWEYFGDWQQVRNTSNIVRVGGFRGIIVSKRVRQTLQQLNVRRLLWVPISILKEKSLRPSGGKERAGPPNKTSQPPIRA